MTLKLNKIRGWKVYREKYNHVVLFFSRKCPSECIKMKNKSRNIKKIVVASCDGIFLLGESFARVFPITNHMVLLFHKCVSHFDTRHPLSTPLEEWFIQSLSERVKKEKRGFFSFNIEEHQLRFIQKSSNETRSIRAPRENIQKSLFGAKLRRSR